jgi:hypothetical protein
MFRERYRTATVRETVPSPISSRLLGLLAHQMFMKTVRGAGTLACCIDTHVDVRQTPRRDSAQHAKVRAPRGVFKEIER